MYYIYDCLKHNTNTVYAFTSKIMPLIKKFQLLCYFKDGVSSQYKYYKNFGNLYYHLYDYDIQLSDISLQQVMVKVHVME